MASKSPKSLLGEGWISALEVEVTVDELFQRKKGRVWYLGQLCVPFFAIATNTTLKKLLKHTHATE